MARQPEVFVHELEPEQAQRLVKITRSTRDRVRLRRAGVVLASVQGRPANEIAVMFAATENYVREVIHAFNAQGFAALDPKWSGGRPAKFGSGRPRPHLPYSPRHPERARATVHHVEPDQTGLLPASTPPPGRVHRDHPTCPAPGRHHLAAHEDLEDQP
jgi:Helix-turn-helix domain